MFVSDSLNVNAQGHLTVGGADAVTLAQEYGTPLYVMDEMGIRENCRQFKASIDRYYGRGLVCYASKAFCCKEMYRIIKSEGLGIDVVSGGELYTAQGVAFPADRIVFHGNNKTRQELEMALDYGVTRIVVDNLDELAALNQLAGERGVKAGIMFRIKPGIDAHTHSFIQTGQIDSKFGLALETGEAMEAVREAIKLQHIELVGLHCHIGSQIFDIAPFELAAQVMIDFLYRIQSELGYTVKELNLGGGFGVKYLSTDEPAPYDAYMERVSAVVRSQCARLGMAEPFVLIEPGRAIAAPTGVTLYTVGNRKDIPGVRSYLAIDGGMGDNPRYALYQSAYEIVAAAHPLGEKTQQVTVAGKCCESGDLIGEGMALQPVQPGDIVAVLATGAYNYSMSSNYNRIPRPAVVMVRDGQARIAVERESYEDVVRNDR